MQDLEQLRQVTNANNKSIEVSFTGSITCTAENMSTLTYTFTLLQACCSALCPCIAYLWAERSQAVRQARCIRDR